MFCFYVFFSANIILMCCITTAFLVLTFEKWPLILTHTLYVQCFFSLFNITYHISHFLKLYISTLSFKLCKMVFHFVSSNFCQYWGYGMIISRGFHLLLLQGVLPLLVRSADVPTSTQTNKSYTCLKVSRGGSAGWKLPSLFGAFSVSLILHITSPTATCNMHFVFYIM